MQKNKIVLDVNIWISLFINKQLYFVDDLVFKKNITICRCDELTNELVDVMPRKKFDKTWKKPIEKYLSFYEDYTVAHSINLVFEGCPDKKDNYLFDLAYQSSALYLVSGDKKVLSTPLKPPLQVITLADFKKIFS